MFDGCILPRLPPAGFEIDVVEDGRAEPDGAVTAVARNEYWIYARQSDGWVIVDVEKGSYIGDILTDAEFHFRYPDVRPVDPEVAFKALKK